MISIITINKQSHRQENVAMVEDGVNVYTLSKEAMNAHY